jgi:protein involved in polysaccharide export with SLBB domain
MPKNLFYFICILCLLAPAVTVSQTATTPPANTSPYDNANKSSATPQSASSSQYPRAQKQSGPVLTAPKDPGANMKSASAPQIQPVMHPEDFQANMNSEVFGAQLFTGQFARQSSPLFNPDYAVSVGDTIQVRMWGGFEFASMMIVDPKGNIFLPIVGPVHVLGVRNKDLQKVVESAARGVYKANVYCYASLTAAQPVRIFVGGFVRRPGLYNGTSMDSMLYYLDQAGGIDPDRGTFLVVQIKRSGLVRASINLYDFLLEGNIPIVQFADGDIIFVGSRRNTVKVGGLVENLKRFEFLGENILLSDIARYSRPKAETTHVRVARNTGPVKNTEYYPLSESGSVKIVNGDEVEFTADKKPGTITVRVEGEHLSPQEYVLPYGSRLKDVMSKIKFSERSEESEIQLFRQSVKERQKYMLTALLRSLESNVLTARSATGEEAQLRAADAALVLQWIERAKLVEPTGQVVIAGTELRNNMLLENGDIVKVPVKDGLVLVSGEVLFPNSIAFDPALGVHDYVKRTGGYTQNASSSRIIIAHVDGSFDEADSIERVRPGDKIMVLPKVDNKIRMFVKDIVQIIFQIAVSARSVTLL